MSTDPLPDAAIPEGFVEMEPYGPFHETIGLMYHLQRGDNCVVGVRMTERHRNKGQMVHGAMLMALVDTAMTRACADLRQPDQGVVTTTLNNEFLAAARPGDWVEAEVEVLRAGRKVIFMDCQVRRDGKDGPLLLHSSGTFMVVTRG